MLISRTLRPRYCSRNYASKIHLPPALTNFWQTRFPGFRKYLHGSAAVIPASRRFTLLSLRSTLSIPLVLSLLSRKISRDHDFSELTREKNSHSMASGFCPEIQRIRSSHVRDARRQDSRNKWLQCCIGTSKSGRETEGKFQVSSSLY